MRLPKVIIKTLDDRLQRALLACDIDISNDKLFDNLDLNGLSVKDKSQMVLMQVYEVKGYDTFMSVVDNMRKFSNKDKSAVSEAKGEIAEIVCEVMVLHYIKVFNLKDWYICRGLILGSKKDKNFSTELDLVLCTPHCASVIEIKSYNGEKVVTGECTIDTPYVKSKDVYGQNLLHIRSFWENFKQCSSDPHGAVKSVLFSFSHGPLVDKRTHQAKQLMPVFTDVDFMSYLSALRGLNRKPSWDVGKLQKAIIVQRKNARSLDEHVQYLKDKHK